MSTREEGVRGKHNHYYKDVQNLEFIDVYRVLVLFNVTDPCLQHAIKKLLVAGGRGAGKDIAKDIQEAIDCLVRWQGMRAEEQRVVDNSLNMPPTGPYPFSMGDCIPTCASMTVKPGEVLPGSCDCGGQPR